MAPVSSNNCWPFGSLIRFFLRPAATATISFSWAFVTAEMYTFLKIVGNFHVQNLKRHSVLLRFLPGQIVNGHGQRRDVVLKMYKQFLAFVLEKVGQIPIG
jgi:hypothetical protein